jgi:hypothetical protein
VKTDEIFTYDKLVAEERANSQEGMNAVKFKIRSTKLETLNPKFRLLNPARSAPACRRQGIQNAGQIRMFKTRSFKRFVHLNWLLSKLLARGAKHS